VFTSTTGVVANGVVIPNAPLPEGAQVDIQVRTERREASPPLAVRLTANELRKMPRAERAAALAAAAVLAEADYLNDKDLTGFDAFREEEFDDDSESGRDMADQV
jgi:formylmethanofuran dehydrogenase subunit A